MESEALKVINGAGSSVHKLKTQGMPASKVLRISLPISTDTNVVVDKLLEIENLTKSFAFNPKSSAFKK